MMKRVLMLVIASTVAAAAQTIPPQQPPTKDRKDLLIEALQGQRDDYANKQALCYADANNQLAERAKEIAALKAEIETLKKPKDAK